MNHTELSESIEQSPFSLDRWLELWDFVGAQNDHSSRASIAVIIRGLHALKYPNSEESRPFPLIKPILAQLARFCNNGKLFKEAGKVYLQDFHLVEIAQEHLKHAKALGCDDAELASLAGAAKAFSNLKSVANESGVTQRPYATQSIGTLFRKTARICLQRQSQIEEVAADNSSMEIPEEPSARLKDAQKAIASSDWDSAQRLLSGLSAHSIDKDILWDVWTQVAEGLFEARRFEQAEVAYREACLIYPDMLISQFNWGVGLQMVNRYAEALEAYARADALEPDHPKVWCNIGTVHFLMENFREAEMALRKTVVLKKDYARAWDNLGAALGAQDKLEEALNACTCAITFRPTFPEAQFKLGIIYFSQKRFEKALNCLALAVSHKALSFYTNVYISMSFSELGILPSAERELAIASEADGSVPEVLGMAWRALGRARMEKMEYKPAIAALQEACRLNPADSQNWLDLGLAHQFVQEDGEASHCFGRVVELDEVATLA